MLLNTEIVANPVVHWLRPEEESAWDAFVAAHPRGLIYHSSSWKRVLEQAFEHIQCRFFVLRDSSIGEIQGGIPLYTVKSWLLGNRLVSVPFAPFCDPLLSSDTELDQLLPGIREFSRQTSCRRIEIRIRKTEHAIGSGSLPVRSIYKHHFLPLHADVETLFRNFAKSPVRQMIARASKAGVSIRDKEGGNSVATCHDILAQARLRLSLPPMPLRFFSAMQSHLAPQRMKTFLAFHNGKAVGCHLVLISGDSWISEYLGKLDGAINGVNQLLYWEAIKAAHAAGAKVFSFGRTSLANEGLLVHKRRWGTIEEDLLYCSVPVGTGKPLHIQSQADGSYSSGYRLARFVAGIAPKCMSQTIGDFFYRHLG